LFVETHIDTITIVKNGTGVAFYKGSVKLTINQVLILAKDVEKAYYLLNKADDLRMAGICFGVIGGACLGYSLGYTLGKAMYRSEINMTRLLPILLIGVAGLVVGISFEICSNNKAFEGINIYNNTNRQQNNTTLNFGFSTNGISLRLNF
jgi:hypothetical protein